MAMTGVKLDSEVLPFINSMNIDKRHKYAVFKITDNKKFIKLYKAEEQDPKERSKTKDEDRAAFQEMVEYLQDTETVAAYILYDFCFISDKLGRAVEQLVFLNFCLDDAPGTKRMLHAGSKKTLTEAAKVVQLEFQVTEWSELNYDELSKGVEAKKRI